jgi:methionyl-tRNA formyltransferase
LAQPESLKDGGLIRRLEELDVEAAVLVAFGRLIPSVLLQVPAQGFVNLHPSLLPRHRGPSPIQWSIVSGDEKTGVSTMVLDEGMDTGPLLLQEEMVMPRGVTTEELSVLLAEKGAELLVRTLDGLEAGRISPAPQPEEGATTTPMIRRSFAKIDWGRPAIELERRLRGFTPWPGLYTKFRGGRLKIHSVEVVTTPRPGKEVPGTVVAVAPEGISVRCGRGSVLRLTELQREGRRRLPVDAFLVGEPVAPGERLG